MRLDRNVCVAVLFQVLLLMGCGESDKKMHSVKVDALPSPSSGIASEPYLVTHHGTVYLSWLESQDTTAFLRYARLEQNTWSQPVTIATGTSWFINWADYPTIAFNDTAIIAHFLDRSGPGKYSYDVKYVVSKPDGSWSTPRLLNEDGKDAEHGFVSLVPFHDDFFASWLDGRNTSMEGMEGMDHDGHGAMSLRAAIIGKDGLKKNEWLLDDRVCDCCQTSAAITANGPVVVYRDRTSEEVRDMSIVRWQDGAWTEPKSIYDDGWKINGCPVNGPRVSSIENNVAVVWYSAPDDSTQVKVAFSENGGKDFSEPVLINTKRMLGRVDIELLNGTDAAVSWIENDSIQVAVVDAKGVHWRAAVAGISSERSSGFPQMTKRGDDLVFAWTDVGSKSIKTAMVRFESSNN